MPWPTRSVQPSTSISPPAVLQFSIFQSKADAGTLLGRVEHVTTGRSARFHDLPALLDFVRTVLTDQRRRPPASRRED
jgi:hypothetical protein